MATRKRAPSKGSPKIRFVQIVAKVPTSPYNSRGLIVEETPLFGLTDDGQVYAYVIGGWKPLPMVVR